MSITTEPLDAIDCACRIRDGDLFTCDTHGAVLREKLENPTIRDPYFGVAWPDIRWLGGINFGREVTVNSVRYEPEEDE